MEWWLPSDGGYDFTPDYSLGSGYSGGGMGVSAPSYTPDYGSSTADYSLTPSTGGMGMTAPTFTPSYDYNTVDYSLNSGGGSGGVGLSGGSGGSSAPYYDSSVYTPSYSLNLPASNTNPFSLNPNSGGAKGLPTAQTNEGVGLRLPAASSSFGGNSAGAGTGTSNAGVTGDFGVGRNKGGVNDEGSSMLSWARDPQNRDAARLGIQAFGSLAGLYANRQAQKNIDRESAFRQQQFASQQKQLAKNDQMADVFNQQARQSVNEARSLYNPQQMGIQRMADARATTARATQNLAKQMGRAGASQVAIDAEARRARLAGALNENTAYNTGFAAGRTGQAQALSSASGLTRNYGALTGGASTELARYYNDQSNDQSQQMRDFLESYTGYPTLSAAEEARRRMQEGSVK